MQRLRATSALSALSLILIMPWAHAYTWKATKLPRLNASYPIRVTGINNAGQIVGYGSVALGIEHAFLYAGGVMRDLGTVGSGRNSRAYGINDSGQIIGTSETGQMDGSTMISNSYIYKNGTVTQVQGIDFANAINNSGLITGYTTYGMHAQVQDSRTGQVLWINTRSGVDRSFATAINGFGQLIGGESYSIQDDAHAFFHDLSSGITTSIPTPGYGASRASGINDGGWVVGTATSARGEEYRSQAFLYRNGTTTLLINPYTLPAGDRSGASDINNRGEIVGGLYNPNAGTGGTGRGQAVFIGSEGLVDLNTGLSLPEGEFLYDAIAINDRGDIVALSNLGNSWLLQAAPAPTGLQR